MTKKSLRIEYGKSLVELGRRFPSLVALEADLKDSTQSVQFQKAFPKRYIQVGVAEQNMVGIAAGLALAGKIPVAHSFACFISMRACEQVRTSVAFPILNVKFLAAHAGISAGSAGTTHHAIEDIAIMRAIPNMTVLVPGDVKEMRQVLEAAIRYQGPVYIRMPAIEAEDIYGNNDNFSIGKATKLRSGNDVTIITTGIMMAEGVKASDILRRDFGIKARVLQMASIKPIDRKTVIKAARETGCIVTIEEHTILGGLGSAVCEIVAEFGGARVKALGINDHFCGVGSASYLIRQEGLTAERITKEIVSLLN